MEALSRWQKQKPITPAPTAAPSATNGVGSAPPAAGANPQLSPSEPGKLLDFAVDQLFAEDNDLVVNTVSMASIDVNVGAYVTEQYDFGRNRSVYHTNYFVHPRVTQMLTKWYGV